MKNQSRFTLLAFTLAPALAFASGSSLDATGLRGNYVGRGDNGEKCQISVRSAKTLSVSQDGTACRDIEVKVEGISGTMTASNSEPFLGICGDMYANDKDINPFKDLKILMVNVKIDPTTGTHTPTSFTASEIDLSNPTEPTAIFCKNLQRE